MKLYYGIPSSFDKPQLCLSDLVKASLSIRLNVHLDKNYGNYDLKTLINLKLQFLTLVVKEFKILKQLAFDDFQEDYNNAVA